MSFALAFVISAALTGSLLWAVSRWSGFVLKLPDLLLLVVLCGGIALLPRGWILGMAITALLLLRTTEADVWPDAVVVVTGSGLVWLIVDVLLFHLWSG